MSAVLFHELYEFVKTNGVKDDQHTPSPDDLVGVWHYHDLRVIETALERIVQKITQTEDGFYAIQRHNDPIYYPKGSELDLYESAQTHVPEAYRAFFSRIRRGY